LTWNKGWDDLFRSNEWGRYPCEHLVRFVARTFFQRPDRSVVRILEVGCGTGANLWFLAREGFTVTGVDGSVVALDRAAERFAEEGLDVELKRSDVSNLPCADAAFDCVVDIECIYANAMADAREIVSEVDRVLKPGGWFFSKTFAVGMTGEETALAVDGEPRTYRSMPDAPLHGEYGLVRLSDRSDIEALYGGFDSHSVDRVERTDRNGSIRIPEWLVVARKAMAK
jgi:2-polyprenyl-3-methyl-5-hydroxy-6-metoxy-1,4-benzoquinol methylase